MEQLARRCRSRYRPEKETFQLRQGGSSAVNGDLVFRLPVSSVFACGIVMTSVSDWISEPIYQFDFSYLRPLKVSL
jgi:hypothetical protein